MLKKMVIALGVVLASASSAMAAWTPLITSDSFSGISADVSACAAGIVGVLLIILGIGILIRVLSK